MSQTVNAMLLTVGLSLFAVVGDYFLKMAGTNDNPFRTKWFIAGMLMYALSAFGAVYVLKHIKLATVGVVYCVSLILLLTTLGVVFFKESLHWSELIGILLALASLLLLGRFAS
jgi:multidrug transporter EmrE-like cation transporter